ncbi:HTH-type transcriptional regulator DmlR [Sodalis glossinidius str. 'morsitans']|uniref:Transcriptional regulator n=1 Tax=Sodalis glossinidius (strain morsitans) TaxID=343509 RepID=Q2NR23_SODGM|nr:LysR family transcriptional regulator [Sodalis glossinidius]BAE75402.1 transcriptional regulator [Sodalis glossinidius str. 'morsitans']CRL46450.1 HTH-type transcriptional regulator DmlR [Sodalis glossinidius str. 'morsitans']
MNKLALLQSFVWVVELASFTQAGNTLGLPKSTVAEHIQTLEGVLGACLLHRTTRRVTPTQDGLVLYDRARDVLASMEELDGLFRQQGPVPDGRLRVDMPTAFARLEVFPRLGEFLQAHPAIQVEISCTDRRGDVVRKGFDCVVRIGQLNDDNLVARRLGKLRMINYASPAYLRAYGVPVTPADLDRHVLIDYVQVLGSQSEGFVYQQHGRMVSRQMPVRVTVNNADAYEAACLNGLGIIQVPVARYIGLFTSGQLVEILPYYLPPPMDITLLYAHRRHLPPRVKVFIDWLADLIAPCVCPVSPNAAQ